MTTTATRCSSRRAARGSSSSAARQQAHRRRPGRLRVEARSPIAARPTGRSRQCGERAGRPAAQAQAGRAPRPGRHDPPRTTTDPLGGNGNIGFLTDGRAITFATVNLVNIDAIRVRGASPNAAAGSRSHGQRNRTAVRAAPTCRRRPASRLDLSVKTGRRPRRRVRPVPRVPRASGYLPSLERARISSRRPAWRPARPQSAPRRRRQWGRTGGAVCSYASPVEVDVKTEAAQSTRSAPARGRRTGAPVGPARRRLVSRLDYRAREDGSRRIADRRGALLHVHAHTIRESPRRLLSFNVTSTAGLLTSPRRTHHITSAEPLASLVHLSR